MIKRQLEEWLLKNEHFPQIISLFGLRQTGKTTLMDKFRKEHYPEALHYPLYDLVVLRRYESQPQEWVLEIEAMLKKFENEEKVLHVFIDEIQKIPAFFQALQGLYEKYKGKIKFWTWGSSARPLKRQRAETLAGRSFAKILWPFSQAELLQTESVVPLLFDPMALEKKMNFQIPRNYLNLFGKWIQQTMLPEPCLQEDLQLAQKILQSYKATYLENEIRRENLVQDIGAFDQFLSLAASENTGIVNYASKAKALGMSPHTIRAYYGILEDTFVCRSLPAYSKSLRVAISKSPKIYFSDTGLARFVSGELGLPVEGTAGFGFLLEGVAINEVFKQIEYYELPWKTSYLRTRSGMEVDLILSQGAQKIAVEIKASRKISKEDYQALLTLMEMDPEIKHGIVFSLQAAPFKLAKNIYNIPIWNL